MEQSGTRVEQVRGHMGRWVGTFLPFRFLSVGSRGAQKVPENAINVLIWP